MKNRTLKLVRVPAVLLILGFAFLSGCGSDGGTKAKDQNTNGNSAPTYTQDVRPILENGCTCHQSGGVKFADVPLDTYAHVFAKKDRVKTRAGVEGTMPPTGSLPEAERQTIIAWVDGGAPE